jgi:hypothetical protein
MKLQLFVSACTRNSWLIFLRKKSLQNVPCTLSVSSEITVQTLRLVWPYIFHLSGYSYAFHRKCRIFLLCPKNVPLLVTFNTSMIFSMAPMEYFLSSKCWANFVFFFAYLQSRKCSWNLTWEGQPICPMRSIFQPGQITWYTPNLSNCHELEFCFMDSIFPVVFCVVNSIFTGVFFKSLVMNFVSFPT